MDGTLMRLPTRNFLSATSLVGAVAMVGVASATGASGYFGGALLLLGLAAAIGLARVDQRAPSEEETCAFISRLLTARGYGGAFFLRGFSQRVSPGIDPGNMRVRFRGEVVFREPLFQPCAPSGEVFKGFTARRIEWLRRSAEALERELGAEAAGLVERAPMDPHRATYVAVRQAAGWSLSFSGTAWAVAGSEEGWAWDLAGISRSVDTLIVQGKPLSAYPAAVALAAAEGREWLAACLSSWSGYEAEVLALQKRAEEMRAERARDAMGGFFHHVRAGVTYGGVGESLTRQLAEARYFLEFTAAHAGNHTVAFALRGQGRWQAARAFQGVVAFDGASGRVTIQARTSAGDAQPGAGPLLSVAASFEMELQWMAGTPARLEATAVDFLLHLAEVESGELARVLERVREREREVAGAIVPGAIYRGAVVIEGVENSLTVEFVTAVAGPMGAARVVCGEWSGMFQVRLAGPAIEEGFDMALEAVAPVVVARRAADAPAASSGCGNWSALRLRLASGRLAGMVVSGEAQLKLSPLERLSMGSPKNP